MENVISWNVANWITVLLMGAAGYAGIVVVVAMLKRAQGGAVAV